MSKFCPINQPSENSVKPTSEELPLSSDSSRQMCDTVWQFPTAEQCRVVIPPPQSQPKSKGNFAQAVAKRERISQNKMRKPKSFKPQPQRQQAQRAGKIVHSIEHSPRKSDTSSSSGTDGGGSDYVPTLPGTPATTQSSAPTSPPRRSPRKNSLKFPNNGSISVSGGAPGPSPLLLSPQDGGAPAVVKQEISPGLGAAFTTKPPSPSILSRKIRQKRYDEDHFVEITKVDFDLERSKKEYKTSKEETLRLKKRKEILLAEKRKERGKRAGKVLVEKSRECTKKTGKRKAEDTADHDEPRKRHKSRKSHKSQDLSSKDDVVEGEGKTSKQTRSQRLLEGKKTRSHTQRYQRVDPEAEERSDISDPNIRKGSHAKKSSYRGSEHGKVKGSSGAGADVREAQPHEGSSGSRASRDSQRPKPRQNEGWREPDKRPGFVLSKSALQRSCLMLLKYFAENPKRVPELASWRRRGSELEFLKYVRQISSCPGLVYPGYVTGVCKRILEGSKRWNRETLESIIQSSQRDLSTDRQNNSNLRRAQSSIPPLEFDGRNGLMPTTEKTSSPKSEVGTAPPTISEPEKPPESVNNCTSSKNLPRRDRSKSLTSFGAPRSGRSSSPAVVVASIFLTPPNSSPLDTPSRLRPLSGSPSEREDNGAGQSAGVLVAQSNGIDQTHSNARRRRHQSMPINIFDDNVPVNERIAPPSSSQRQRGNALQETSNNAILLHRVNDMNRKLENVFQELLPRIRTNPGPVQSSATAPAPTPPTQPPLHTSVQDPNGPDQRAGKNRKRLTVAQRKLNHQPELDRHAPPHPDLTDDDLIKIGRMSNHYERHRRAPHVFKWNGHLYKEYEYLLLKTVEGKLVWTPEELKRLIGG